MLLELGSAAAGIGGLMSAFGGSKSAKRSTREAKRQFNVQMNESIQRRVADARAAGIHPLYALGASVGASPTMSAGGSSTGGAVGEGIAEAGRAASGYAAAKLGREVASAQMLQARASAARDEAEAQLALSRAKRLEQDMTSRGHDGVAGVLPTTAGGQQEVAFGPAEYKPPVIPTSKRPGVQSGTVPGTIDVMMPDGRSVNLYSPDLGLDEISQADMIYQRAIHKGADALTAVRNFLQRKKRPRATSGRRGRNARNR